MPNCDEENQEKSLEQIAERIARETLTHKSTIWIWAEILAALREAEARGEQRAAALGGTLLDSAIERAKKAEAEKKRLEDFSDRLEDFSDRMEHGFNKAQDELAEMRERAEKAETENMRLFEGAATQAANVLEQHKVELSELRAELMKKDPRFSPSRFVIIAVEKTAEFHVLVNEELTGFSICESCKNKGK